MLTALFVCARAGTRPRGRNHTTTAETAASSTRAARRVRCASWRAGEMESWGDGVRVRNDVRGAVFAFHHFPFSAKPCCPCPLHKLIFRDRYRSQVPSHCTRRLTGQAALPQWRRGRTYLRNGRKKSKYGCYCQRPLRRPPLRCPRRLQRLTRTFVTVKTDVTCVTVKTVEDFTGRLSVHVRYADPPYQNRPKYGCPRPLRGPPYESEHRPHLSRKLRGGRRNRRGQRGPPTVHVCPSVPRQTRPKYGCPRPLRGPPLTKASTAHVCPGISA